LAIAAIAAEDHRARQNIFDANAVATMPAVPSVIPRQCRGGSHRKGRDVRARGGEMVDACHARHPHDPARRYAAPRRSGKLTACGLHEPEPPCLINKQLKSEPWGCVSLQQTIHTFEPSSMIRGQSDCIC
jgi:hypothetical protein